MSNKLYIGNLPFQALEGDLKDYFGDYGTVVSVKIVKDHDSGRSKCFGFVEMNDASEADDCIRNLDGQEFQGRRLKVNTALERDRSKRPPRGRHHDS